MSNDLRVGLFVGITAVIAVAVLFFQKEPNPATAKPSPPQAVIPADSTPNPTASIPGPLPRPKPKVPALSNPLP